MKKKRKWDLNRYGKPIAVILVFAAAFTIPVLAGDLKDNGTKLLNDVSGWIVGASTAAAGIGVGTGVFMRKLSMGKPEKIETGGKIIKTSITGWAVLNGLTLILNFIKGYLS